jgi:saccharopine dehydrogenase-like NADP-dependent oxidoreductase
MLKRAKQLNSSENSKTVNCSKNKVNGGETGMSEEKEKRKAKVEDAEELREVLGVVSQEVPALIKSIIGSVFSEEAGRDMGKAAAAFYKELKDAGMPEESAVEMTESYVSVFTSLGDVMRRAVSGEHKVKGEDVIGEEISRKIKEKLAEKYREEDEEEEE